jgi:hypothetical protein
VDDRLWLAPLAGIALAAACGLRAFLPLFVVGLAARLGVITLHGGSRWMAGDLALIALGVATVVEILGDKVPVVDHVLDAIGTVVRPIAAWVGAYAVLSAWPTPWGQLAAVGLGTVAVGVHVLKAKLRIGSTAVTAGAANPVLSIGEDLSALATSVLAIVAPILIALILVLFAIVLARRRRPALPPPAHGERSTPLSSRP